MANDSADGTALLERYAQFYEEVARIKLAIRDGNLPMYLGGDQAVVNVGGQDLAAMVSYRLKNRLTDQLSAVEKTGTNAEMEAYRVAQYVMAVQADELFILDLDWPGREAWSGYLLEMSLFRTGNAGHEFFVRLEELLKSRAQDPLQEELATVFLMAMQLGFKGKYRGAKGEATLRQLRQKLLQFIGAGHESQYATPAFQQAYQYRLSEARGERLAPLSRWYYIGTALVLMYLGVSSVVWWLSVQRFSAIFGAS